MSEQKARRVNQERTSLATAIAGMKHWDWCPICRGGLDTGLECDQCGADLMPIYKAFKDHQARPTDSAVLRAIKARADRSRLGYGGKAWVTSDPKSEVVEDRMILIEIVCRQEIAINRLCAALNEAADSFKNAGLSVDAEDCERVIEESLSGGNPGEPKACTGAEERGISGATGAGQLPDGNPESTGDSADRRSPGGTERTPSPDESHRHFERGCHIIMELMQAYERRVRSDCTTQEQIDKRPWECAEYIKAAEYLRKVWPPHEPGASRLADDEGIVCVLASHLAKCDGHDDPNHLIWEGGPIPEPWGEVWCRYEEPAKEILRLIDGCLTPKGCTPVEPSGWQPIETAPDSVQGEYPDYGLYWNGHHVGVGYTYVEDDGEDTRRFSDEGGEFIEPPPTHWQPLPAPPSADPAPPRGGEPDLLGKDSRPHEPLPHQPISTAKEMTMETVDSTSDQRTVNNVMRHAYRVLSDAEKAQMQAIKDKGLEFWELIDSIGASRELSLAKTASEEAVMWAVKHITK